MKKKYFLVLIAFLCLIATGFGQVKIAELTFETPGGYTTSVAEFSDGGTDYFTRTDGSNIGGAVVLSNIQGSYYFAVQDTDGDGNPTNLILNFNNIDISGYSNLELRIHIAEDDDGSNQDWDATSYMHISGSIDSGASQNLIWIEAAGGTNTEPRLDTTFNGTGNGTAITDTFSQFTNIISGSGNLLDIEIEFNNLRNGDEDIAIDNIEIWGVATTPTPTITATPTTITGLDYSFGNGPSAPQSFDIEGTLLTAGIDITAPTNFEIATSVAGPYNSTVNIPALDANNTNTIYVRLVSGLVQASYSGTITMTNATSGLSSTPTVDVSGEVTAPAPSNNDCSGAISLTPNASCTYTSYTNVNATDSGIPDPSCSSYGGGDVWFSVTVPVSGEITIETSNNGGLSDTAMALYSGSCGSLTEIDCDDDSGSGTMSLINATGLSIGSTVYIRVFDYQGNNEGTFDICVTTPTPCTAPTNQPTNKPNI